MSYLIFVNLAVLSAIVFYITRTIKKSFQYEVAQIVGLFRSANLPPGPLGLPFLGSIPSVAGTDGYTPFSQLAKTYGGMAYFTLGKKSVLVMREPALIKDAYRLVAFSDRPKTSFKDDGLIGNKGIIQSVGNVWSEHRRLILSAFRTIGLKSAACTATPQTMQIAEKMQQDVREYLTFVQAQVAATAKSTTQNQPVNGSLERLTGRLAGSCVSSCVLGLPKSFGDRDFAENVAVIEEGFRVGEKLAPFEVMPVLKRVPGMWRKVQEKMKRNHCVTCKYFTGLIREKLTETGATSGAGDQSEMVCQTEPDSLITIYRQEMVRRDSIPALENAPPTILSELQLMQTMTDLFCAATETVKYSLMWMMLYMAKYPEIQKKVQEEIDSLSLTEDELVSWNDLSLLPYTEATILECMRLRPVLPFGHPRAVHEAGAEFRGYQIPKNTVVLALIWDIHQDPRYFENPLQFRPSRFINEEGKTFRPENFIPFGTGRRVCLGDQMAMMQLFTAFAGILKRYTIVPKSGHGAVDLSWKILLSLLIPSAFDVDLLPRSSVDRTISDFPSQHSV